MDTFVALDVAIGLAFTYLLLAIACTAINEWIATVFRLRAKTLKTAVSRLVDAQPATSARRVDATRLSGQIFAHPLIRSATDGKAGPSYIAPSRFVAALTDIIEAPAAEATPAADIEVVQRQRQALRKAPAPRIRRAPRAALAAQPPQELPRDESDRLEEWFNEAMDRATGWYRRRLMWITIAVSVVLTVASNADTIAAARTLWHNPTVRAAVVAQAEQRARRPRPGEGGAFIQADYPDRDTPISGASGEIDESNPEYAATVDDDVEEESIGITEAERMALAQVIGWGRDFREANRSVCAERQITINEACRGGATTSAACTKAIDEGTAGGACRQAPNGLEPTDAFPGRVSWLPLLGTHFLGWLLTIAAVSLGAPFWFDTLNRFISIRGAGKKPEEQSDKA
jgi:hypothetical protein